MAFQSIHYKEQYKEKDNQHLPMYIYRRTRQTQTTHQNNDVKQFRYITNV